MRGGVRAIRKSLLSALILAGAATAVVLPGRYGLFDGFERADLHLEENCRFTDRNGTPLRILPDAREERHLWVPGKEIPEAVKRAVLAAEDRRFYLHPGFDPFAILRALQANLHGGRIVSGASTITQQVARLLHPRGRSYEAKFIEVLQAVRIEMILSKEEILEQYLNRVPLGNNLRGVEVASRVYFGKGVRDVTVAEAALLAALPKAPGRLDPYGPRRETLMARKEWVLTRMAACGYLDEEAHARARRERLAIRPFSFPFGAPHVVDFLLARGVRGPGEHRTTLDALLQADVERIVASRKELLSLRKVRQAAVLVVHNRTMDVLASAGSLAHGPKDRGFNDGTSARRSAGSTLKPFLYAQALDDGITAATLLNDTLQAYGTPRGDYRPDNFDRKEYGPVTVRVALANSLNISAVRTLEALPPGRFERLLTSADLLPRREDRLGEFGLGLAIGNTEVRLSSLVAAYAMLANGGTYRPLRYLLSEPGPSPRRLLSREASYIVSDILADPSARLPAFGAPAEFDLPFRVSIKTGTGTGYRDGWIVGYTPDYTVGVWTGNFDGMPSTGSTGASAAAPILRQVMELLHGHAPPVAPPPPPGVVSADVCGLSGMIPGPECRHVSKELFLRSSTPERTCAFHREDGDHHRLPVEFARWLFRKHRAGAAGRYRLAGLPDALDTLFGEAPESDAVPPEASGIRIREAVAAEVPERNPAPPSGSSVERSTRITIGLLPDGSADLPTEAKGEIRILYPLAKDRFLFPRSEDPAEIPFEAVPSEPVLYVDWYVDGKHLVRAGPPYAAKWKPERGKHRILAATPGQRGADVTITVE
ncbi:MAG: membrane carboxypeptidase/penicillin-binding protein PbpC [Actinobacteria bacterium]|nr:membrane carboxypeptidase/penicillin-binding protein PbpC [Actinomycetota bacterium]